jgi:hypothetical protein
MSLSCFMLLQLTMKIYVMGICNNERRDTPLDIPRDFNLFNASALEPFCF